MAIAMVAMLAFGGTYAYFTAEAKDLATSGLTTGKVEIAVGAEAAIELATSNVVPGQKFLNASEILLDDGDTNVAMYVFAKVTTKVNDTTYYYATKADPSLTAGSEDFAPIVSVGLAGDSQAWEEQTVEGVYGALYSEVTDGKLILDGTLAEGIVAHRTEGSTGDITEEHNIYTKNDDGSYTKLANTTSIEGVSIVVTVEFFAIQADVVGSLANAYTQLAAKLA